MKKTILTLSAAALAAASFAAPALARPYHHDRDSGVSLRVGEGGASLTIRDGDRGYHHRRLRRGPGYSLYKERRDVQRARRHLRREQRQLDRALASGRRGWINAERRDVRQARRRLRRELRDL